MCSLLQLLLRLFLGVAVFFCYFNLITLFTGFLALFAERVRQGRHCVTCQRVTSDADPNLSDVSARAYSIFCAGAPPATFTEEAGVCKPINRAFHSLYPRLLLHWLCKTFVFVLFAAYLCVAIWSVTNVSVGLQLSSVLTSQHPHHFRFNQLKATRFAESGPVLTFGVATRSAHLQRNVDHPTPCDVRTATRHLLCSVYETFADVNRNASVVSWLASFDSEAVKSSRSSPGSALGRDDSQLLSDFLARHTQFRADVTFAVDNVTLRASRLFVFAPTPASVADEQRLVRLSRAVTNNVSVSMSECDMRAFVFARELPFFEHNTSVLKDTLLVLCVSVVGLLFVALIFVPHPIAISCVTSSMASIALGAVACAALLRLPLSVFTLMPLVLSVTQCADATVHVSHAFMTVTGKTRNDRVAVALEKVGVSVLGRAVSLILAIAPLGFASSYEFVCFCKLLSVGAALVVLHALVFIPVLLSFIGPRRTSKPRVFIPVSNSARSLQDTYRANSLTRPTSEDILKFRQQRLKQLRELSAQMRDDVDSAPAQDAYEMTSRDVLTRSQSAEELPTAQTTTTSLNDCDVRSTGAYSRRVSFAIGTDDVTPARRSTKKPRRQLTRTEEVDVDDVTLRLSESSDVTERANPPIKFYVGRSVSRE